MTVRDLILASMQEIGALAAGEPLGAADADAGLLRLKSMLDLWQSERLTIYNTIRTTFSIVANQATYTIGPSSANVAMAIRPQWIDHLSVVTDTGEDEFEMPIELLTDKAWATDLTMKNMTMEWPTKATYTPTVPNGTLDCWPVPTDSALWIALYVPTPLTTVITLDTVLVLAPGYEEDIRYNLAVRLAPIFGKQLDPTVATLAVDTKAQVKRTNITSETLKCDPALVSDSGAWNVYSGGF
jgi:hypothetical protein